MTDKPCPSCGYCPTCGRKPNNTWTYTYPYSRPIPMWSGGITVQTTSGTSTTQPGDHRHLHEEDS